MLSTSSQITKTKWKFEIVSLLTQQSIIEKLEANIKVLVKRDCPNRKTKIPRIKHVKHEIDW